MRAWHCTFLVFALACGGTTDDSAMDDGGGTDGTTNDGFVAPDTSPGNDGSVGNDASTADGGGQDGTVTEAGPFDPTSLGSSLVLWLEGDKGVTQTNNDVSAWADQTSNHNDASGGTGNGAHQPTVNATAINGLPAIEFAIPTQQNAPSQWLDIADSASLQFGTGDFAIFMVAEYTNDTTGNGGSQAMFYYKVAGNTVPTGPQLIGNSASGANNTLESRVRARLTATDAVNSTNTGYNDGKFHRIGIRRNGQALEVWTDGTLTSLTPDAGAAGDVSATGTDVNIGAAETGGNFVNYRLAGAIAEVIGVKGTISDGDVGNLDGYFKSKYGLQ